MRLNCGLRVCLRLADTSESLSQEPVIFLGGWREARTRAN